MAFSVSTAGTVLALNRACNLSSVVVAFGGFGLPLAVTFEGYLICGAYAGWMALFVTLGAANLP